KKFIRRGTSYTPVSIAPGMGAQILVGMQAGDVFIYDIEHDSISYLDTRTGVGNLNSVWAYSDKRLAAYADVSGAKFQIASWGTDDATSTRSGNVVSEAWDEDIPEERKTLFGVHVVFKPMTGS